MAKAAKKGLLMYALSIRFPSKMEQKECFAYLFRTVPVQRLNNCFIIRGTDYSDEPQYLVCITGYDREQLAEILSVLQNASQFTDIITEGGLSLGQLSAAEDVLASVTNYKLKTGKRETNVVEAGAKLAAEQPRIRSELPFAKIQCKRCGHDTKGLPHCPNCKKQQRGVSTTAFIYLVVLIGLHLFDIVSVFDPEWLQSVNPWVWMAMGIAIFQFLGVLIAVLLLASYRKSGFRLLVGIKLIDIVIGILAGGQSLFMILVPPLVYLFIAYLFLNKDLPDMK